MENLQSMEDFVSEYDEIFERLQDLFNETHDKRLKKELDGFISVLMEDFGKERDEYEDILMQTENEELEFLNQEFEKSRL